MKPLISPAFVLTAAVGAAAQGNLQLQHDASLAAPRPLFIGGATAASPDGYAAPTLADVNGDGRIDLLLGDFGTEHGSFEPPKGEDPFRGGAAGQFQLFLGEGDGSSFRFDRSNWATTRDGTVQSPSW